MDGITCVQCSIVTMCPFCIISNMQTDIGLKSQIFHTLHILNVTTAGELTWISPGCLLWETKNDEATKLRK